MLPLGLCRCGIIDELSYLAGGAVSAVRVEERGESKVDGTSLVANLHVS